MASRSRETILPLVQSLAVYLLLLFFTACESQPVTCYIDTSDGGQVAILTCDFGHDMQKAQSDLSVQRFNETAYIENLVKCVWIKQSYECTVYNRLFSLNSSKVSQFLTLRMFPVSVEARDDYYLCKRSHQEAFPAPCSVPRVGTPGPPALRLVGTSSSSIEVSWETDDDGGTSLLRFELNYTTGDKEWQSVHLNSSYTTYSATGLLCGTLYRFVVRAFNAVGASPPSSVLEARTNGSVPVMLSERRLLKEINVTTVTLDFIAWRSAGCPIRFFCLKYRRRSATIWRVKNNISSDVRELTVDELEAGSEYAMKVTAESDAGDTTCHLRFVTLHPSPAHTTDASTKTRDAEADTALIAPVVVLSVLLVGTVLALVFCCYRKHSPRMRKQDRSSEWPLTDDTEMESTDTK